MTTNYKNSIPSPYKEKREVNPLEEEMQKNTGSFNISVQIEKDIELMSLFKHIPGFIAFKATLRKDNEIIGIGSGTGVLNRLNKFVERTVIFAKNASLIDAMVRSTKILDAISINPSNTEEAMPEDILASEKQKSYLRKLVSVNVSDGAKRKYWESQIDSLTKDEASEKIQSFVKNY